ncbi:MAG: type II toxin-antitoxin system prevent-host-death family antitoxin [Candidatus Omnitrophica bacterium]|nr:type II toxin-antitoxin system prevent-host-death family antitoxin [Candidatus Omnitrophota bacterium]
MTTKVSAVEARKNLGKFLNIVQLRNEEIIIERAGRPIAKLTPFKKMNNSGSEKGDFRRTRGLGKELWEKIDVEDYIKKERAKWD